MSGFGQKYVVDTNTLSQIGRRRRATEFFMDNVVLPEEVLREARAFPDIGSLRNLIYPTTSHVLDQLIRVMATVPVDDTKLVNLYSNKGGADPLLVACALDGQARDSGFLDAPEWVVVTGDEAVHTKAAEFGLTSLTNDEFAALVDASEPQVDGDEFDETHAEAQPSSWICPQCGAEGMPEPLQVDDRFRIAFVCPAHGVQAIMDPFEDGS